MFTRRVGVAALAISSVFGLTTIAAARDHDDARYYDHGYYAYGDRSYRGMTDHERHEWEERREKEARQAQRRLEWEQRRAARNGYYNNGYYSPYNNGYYGPYTNAPYNDPYYRNNNVYYDRYGNWIPYRR